MPFIPGLGKGPGLTATMLTLDPDGPTNRPRCGASVSATIPISISSFSGKLAMFSQTLHFLPTFVIDRRLIDI
jgi:hypothetical protein